MADKMSVIESRAARMHNGAATALYDASYDIVGLLHDYRDILIVKDQEIRNLKKRLRSAEETVKKMSEG